jgi:hypothetical protein
MAEFINAKALAKKLRVKPATILAWARRGWIPCLRAGRRPILFDAAEVESALRERADRQRVSQLP